MRSPEIGASSATLREADRRYPFSRGFRTAFLKGADARRRGRPLDVCPYRSRGGWAAWRRAWQAGWEHVDRAEEQR